MGTVPSVFERLSQTVTPLFDATSSNRQITCGNVVSTEDFQDGYPHMFRVEPVSSVDLSPIAIVGSEKWDLGKILKYCRHRRITPTMHYESSHAWNLGMLTSRHEQLQFLRNVRAISRQHTTERHLIATGNPSDYDNIRQIWRDMEIGFGPRAIFLTGPESVAKTAANLRDRKTNLYTPSPLFDIPIIAFIMSTKPSKQEAVLPDLDTALERAEKTFGIKRRMIVVDPRSVMGDWAPH